MPASTVAFLLILSYSVSAHFQLKYPYWRADSFTAEGANQWIWPCANVTQETSANNRTLWPTKGGSLLLSDSHPDALTYVNIGLGNEVTSFNVSLLSHFNQTGNGTLCLQNLGGDALAELVPANGVNASIQVVTINGEGNALYNCADITFSDDAKLLFSSTCKNATGVSGSYIGNLDQATSTNSSDPSASSESAASSSSPGAGSTVHAPAVAALMMGVVVIGAFVEL